MRRVPSTGRVIVTHAERAVQRAIVIELLDRGAHVALVGEDQDALLALAKHASDRSTVIVGDLHSDKHRERVIPHAVRALGGLDAAVIGANDFDPTSLSHPAPSMAMSVRPAAHSMAPSGLPPIAFDPDAFRTGTVECLVTPSLLAHAAVRALVEAAPTDATGVGGALLLVLGAPTEREVARLACHLAMETIARGLAAEYASKGIRANALSVPDGVAPAAAADLALHLIDAPGMTGTVVPVPRPMR